MMAKTAKKRARKGSTEQTAAGAFLHEPAAVPKPKQKKGQAPRADRLETYRAKRRFDVTPEPPPSPEGSSQAAVRKEKKSAKAARSTTAAVRARPSIASDAPSLAFVVQKHDARRLHYDVRLEVDGAMVSWAVPKGPSFDPAVRRLAVQTEDHPMAYNAFEGRIPDGEYGAGDVLIWDRGTYDTVPPGQQRPMLEKGHLHVRIAGEKLVGDWHLVRTGGRAGDDGSGRAGKAQWLMFKAKDAQANPTYDVVAERPESVVSGRQGTRGPQRVGASESGKSARALFEAVGEPALATAVTTLPDRSEWHVEVKYDGYRLLACKAADDVRLYTRRANDWTDRFAPIVLAIAKLRARECVVDGEACAIDSNGRPSFAALQEWLGDRYGSSASGKRPSATTAARARRPKDARIGYVVFDLLWLDGRDLRREPIEARRELLEKLVEGGPPAISFSRTAEGEMAELVKAAKTAGLEGLVAKKKGSAYVGGRSMQWLKLRFGRRQECAIAGWIPMAGSPDDVGALLLAVVDGGELVFAGRVGTGFDDRTRQGLAKRLAADRVDAPLVEDAPKIQGARWVRPTLVCECAFTAWTSDGSMRHPRFVALREDKSPTECVREREGSPDAPPPSAPPPRPQKAAPPSPPAGGDAPKLGNPEKVLFPRDGITKRHVWDYYTAIAPQMLPHLAGRPLALQRYPDGIDGEEWYQQNAPDKVPRFVHALDAGARHDHKKRVVCDNVETLQWLANLAALTIHQWCSHVPAGATTRAAIDRALALPDYVILDLDPGDGPWEHLIEVADSVRALLDALELTSVVKTSGKRGLHVVVPIAQGPTHDAATGFAEQVARAVAKVLPGVATVERMKDRRGGRLYVDFGQNGEGRTIVSPYTIRARDGGIVSTPIEWSEVGKRLDPTRFTMRAVLDRVEKKGDLFAGVLNGRQSFPSSMARDAKR